MHKQGRVEESITARQTAIAIFQETGDRQREGGALNSLGQALTKAKRFEEAIAAYRAAIAIFREIGDRQHEGRTLLRLGSVLGYGRLEEAITAYRDAASIFRETGDQADEQRALKLLRSWQSAKREMDAILARLESGRFDEIITDLRKTAAVLHQHGDRYGQGVTSAILGNALLGAGRFDDAITALETAAAIFGETGDKQREGTTLTELRAAQQAQCDAKAAATALDRALRQLPEQPGDAELRAAMEGSYRDLGPSDARLFRLLSLNPGPDISTPAAAILAVTNRATITGRLKELTDASLLRNYPRLFRRLRYLYGEDEASARNRLETLARAHLIEQSTKVTGAGACKTQCDHSPLSAAASKRDKTPAARCNAAAHLLPRRGERRLGPPGRGYHRSG